MFLKNYLKKLALVTDIMSLKLNFNGLMWFENKNLLLVRQDNSKFKRPFNHRCYKWQDRNL